MGEIDHFAISDSQDTELVLATVAATVLEFTSHFPDAIVYAKGSTSSRTRLYQIGISSNWIAIEPLLHVYGFTNGSWQPFKKNINYEAFLVIRK
jgi:hypothetical protein